MENVHISNTLSLVSFAGMTLNKCTVHRIGTLTGCPLCRESHPLCRLKSHTVIKIWLLVGFHPATRSVQSTPYAREGVRQYIAKERKTTAMLTRLSKSTGLSASLLFARKCLSFSFSIYCLALAFEHYQQVYIVHSGLQDESLQVTISKLP